MDGLVRGTLIRVLASMTDEELTGVLTEARDNWEPGPEDYRAVAAQLQGQPDPKKVAATDALVRNVRNLKSSAPTDQPEDPKKVAAADALRRSIGGG